MSFGVITERKKETVEYV